MNIKPTGYYILVEVEVVSETIEEGNLQGFILHSPENQKREQTGNDTGTVIAIGPQAHVGFDGCTGKTAKARAKQWGYEVGDTVEFTRYEGKLIEDTNYRLIPDDKIIAVRT